MADGNGGGVNGGKKLLLSPSLSLSSSSSSSSSLSSSEEDTDDWFEDYNPSDYESYNANNERNNNNKYNNNDRSSRTTRGGGGSGYRRDTSRDNSNVNEEAVYALIEQRSDARRDRDYDLADVLRDKLLTEYGVRVFDKTKEWRSGCSISGSGMKSGNYNNPRRRRSGGGDRFASRDRDFGPNGHDYVVAPEAGPNASPYTEEEIHSLLAERLQCKLSRSFQRADQIQFQLSENGVFVHDGWKQWRADGELFGGEQQTGPSMNGKPGRQQRPLLYEESEYSNRGEEDDDETTTELPLPSIENLIIQRSKAKISRNYDVADTIRQQLKEEYNIYLDDRLRQWSVGGDFGEGAVNNNRNNSKEYRMSSSVAVDLLDDHQQQTIQALLQQRMEARKVRDFQTADEIRERLFEEYGVKINDRLGEWSIIRDDDEEEEDTTATTVADYDEEEDEEEYEEEYEVEYEEEQEEDEEEEESVSEEEEQEEDDDLTILTVVQLKERLREAGLPVSGNKQELISRLLQQ